MDKKGPERRRWKTMTDDYMIISENQEARVGVKLLSPKIPTAA